jgi:hypothetical protein
LKNCESYSNNHSSINWWCLLAYARFIFHHIASYSMIYLWVEESTVNDLSMLTMLAHTSPVITKSFDSKPIAFAQCGPLFHHSTRSWSILLLLPLPDLPAVSNASSHSGYGTTLTTSHYYCYRYVLMEWIESYQPCLSGCVCCQEDREKT